MTLEHSLLFMNSTTRSAIWYIFAISLFLSSVAYTVFLTTDVKESFKNVPTSQTVYNEQLETPKEVLWTGAQVVGKLYRLTEDDYPIIVGTEVFETDEDVINKQRFIDLQGRYKLKTELAPNGKIQRIIFTYQP